MKGLSFAVSFGKPCWPQIQVTHLFVRVVLGPVGLLITFFDLDAFLASVSSRVPPDRSVK